MSKQFPRIDLILLVAAILFLAAQPVISAGASSRPQTGPAVSPAATAPGVELPCHRIPNLPEAAEWYFSPDGQYLIGTAKGPGDTAYRVYISSFDGRDIRRINDKGEDACSYWGMMPMQIFTLKRDGSARKQITSDEAAHWAPYPAPDGRHFAYVRVLTEPGGRLNWEIYLRNIETGEERRLTCDPAFDGFPSISADGRWMTFSSGRGGKPGERALFQHIMDISSLGVGPPLI